MIFPPALRPGDTIAVVAPASPFEPVLAWVALGWLAQQGYRLRFDRGLFTRTGYLAGPDPHRRAQLEDALFAPGVRAILAARGGYGANRIVHTLDWPRFARDPRWIIGFSDITALHAEAARAGVATIHGPNLTVLGRADLRARRDLLQILQHPLAPRTYPNLRILRPGQARGPLFGGNLTILHACAAAGRLRIPPGAVLLLEDVTERPYRIDRTLTTLVAGGHLNNLAAILLGDFTQCDPGPDGITIDQVLADNLRPLNIPILAGLPVGHDRRNDPITLGAPAHIDATGPHGTATLGA